MSKERRARAPFRPVVLSNNAENAIAGRDQFLTEFDFVFESSGTARRLAACIMPLSAAISRAPRIWAPRHYAGFPRADTRRHATPVRWSSGWIN